MSRLSRLAPRDLDALSAYVDGALSPAEQQAVERRLEEDPVLRQALKEIRTTSALLRALPQVRPPRNFTLAPETAGVRSGWLRTPLLQLATAVAMLAFVVTVGVDVFGGPMQSTAFRAAAPAQEMTMEAPAAVGADALEAGAVAVVTETPAGAETALAAAAPMEVLAATPTAAEQAEEYANREAPTVGGGAGVPPAPLPVATAAPWLAAVPTAKGGCEACGADLELLTPAPQGEAAVTAAPEEASVTEEVVAQVSQPPVGEQRVQAGLPAIRWVEIGLGGIALSLGMVSLRARRRAR